MDLETTADAPVTATDPSETEVSAPDETQEMAMATKDVSLNDLIEAGVHFGHQTRRWNPKMRTFIFAERNGIHIIDLRKTLDRLEVAREAVRKVVLRGERVLFVCTKKQLRGVVEEQAERCGALFVTERWLGGMLTNFQTIRKQIRRLKELERGFDENAYEFYTKKERLLIDRERIKLGRYFSGVKEMGRLPGAVFVVDAHREQIAVRESNRLKVPVIGITDTNADPDAIDYPIPGNDDAIRAVTLIASAIADAVISARNEAPSGPKEPSGDVEATTYSTETGEKVVAASASGKKTRPRPVKRRVKRVPLPEVIAARRKAKASEGGGDEAATPVAEAAVEAGGAVEEVVAAPATESAAEGTPDADSKPATAKKAKAKKPKSTAKAAAADDKADAGKEGKDSSADSEEEAEG